VTGLNPHSRPDTVEPGDLLQELLLTPVTAEREPFRPSQLRSFAEQQQHALKPFLLRNWLDKALLVAERGLAVGAVAVFGFWFFDGPVRDTLHSWQHADPRNSRVVPTATIREQAPAGSITVAALPFTTPAMAEEANESEVVAPPAAAPAGPAFLAPQAMAANPVQADQRPQRMYIPRIALDTPVTEVFIEGAAWQVADYAAGYHHGTALPGTPGNTVMAGHAGLRGAVFRDLPQLTVGDEVIVDTGDWRYQYRVREVKNVWPTQVEVMDPTPTPTLTLITCTNWDTQRLVVVADLVDARPLS
jgi:sortase A